MADANQIEGYNPQPLAFGSTQLPAAANDVVWDMMPGIAAWQHYADQKLAVAKDLLDDLKKKQLAKQVAVAKALDQGQYKIWDADRAEFNKLWGNYTNLVKKVAQRGTWGDVNDDDYLKTLDMAQELDQFAQYSTQQKAHFDVGDEAYLKDNSKYDPVSRKSLDDYRNIGNPIERSNSDYDMKVRSGFDLSKYFPIVLNRLREDNPTLTAKGQDQYGYVTYSHDDKLNVEGATAIAEGTWTSDPDAKDFGEDLYNKNPGQFASPKDAFVQNFVNTTVPKSLQDEIKGRVYAPGSTSILSVPYQEHIPILYTDTTEVAKLNAPLQKELDTLNATKTNTMAEKEAKDKRIVELQNQIATNKKGKIGNTYLIGGHDYTATGNKPANVLITPTKVHDANTGQSIDISKIGTASWNSDLMKEGHVFMNKNGQYIFFNPPPASLQEAQKYASSHGYTLERVALINTDGAGLYDTPQSFLIPYSDAERALINSKVINQPPPPQQVTPQQPAKQKQQKIKPIPSIPPGFTEIREQNGKLYFVNSQTKKVQLIGDASEYTR